MDGYARWKVRMILAMMSECKKGGGHEPKFARAICHYFAPSGMFCINISFLVCLIIMQAKNIHAMLDTDLPISHNLTYKNAYSDTAAICNKMNE